MTPEQQRTATLERIHNAVRGKLERNEALPSPSVWAAAYDHFPHFGITDLVIANVYVEERLAIRQPSEAEGD